jgi:hypothetical protein
MNVGPKGPTLWRKSDPKIDLPLATIRRDPTASRRLKASADGKKRERADYGARRRIDIVKI